MSDWSAWIGREDVRRDHIDPAAVTRWLATLDRPAPADGSVPQAYHWCLGLPDAPTAILGADGHPVRQDSDDSFLPPIPLPRRMWAASKVEFLSPLRPGQSVEPSGPEAVLVSSSLSRSRRLCTCVTTPARAGSPRMRACVVTSRFSVKAPIRRMRSGLSSTAAPR